MVFLLLAYDEIFLNFVPGVFYVKRHFRGDGRGRLGRCFLGRGRGGGAQLVPGTGGRQQANQQDQAISLQTEHNASRTGQGKGCVGAKPRGLPRLFYHYTGGLLRGRYNLVTV